MKLVLNSFFLFFFFISHPVWGDVFFKKYIIYTSGVKIGKLNWEVKIDNQSYSNKIELNSSGILSKLYNFKGTYKSMGNIQKKKINSNKL